MARMSASATFLCVALSFGCGNSGAKPQSSSDAAMQSVKVPKGTISVDDSHDDVVELLRDVRRLQLIWIDADTNDDVRAIDEKAYALRFQRRDGPYRVISIRRMPERDEEAKTFSLPAFETDLKKGMTMGEALPLLQKDGSGHFAFDTRDQFHARVRSSSGAFVLVYFERPKNVPRPDLFATPDTVTRTENVSQRGRRVNRATRPVGQSACAHSDVSATMPVM